MRKDRVRRLGALAVAAACCAMTALPAYGAEPPEKDEVIYVNLTPEGDSGTIYVVNSYDLTGETAIVDYGDYREVRNLTTTTPLEREGDAVKVTAPAGKFYFQGSLDSSRVAELPWRVSVKYLLDGKELPGQQLAGASGHLEIRASLRLNPGADPVYADNYALQTTVQLDTQRCKNIDAHGATLADVGDKKQMSYIVLPGKEKDFTISADVVNFEMDGIQINGIPLVLDIDDPDTSELKDQVYDLQDGAARLDDGARALEEGTGELENGVLELRDGAESLRDGAQTVHTLASTLQEQMGKLDAGLSQVLPMLPPEASAQYEMFRQYFAMLVAGTGEVAGGAYELSEGVDTLYDGVLELKDGVKELADGTLELRDSSSDIDSQVDDKVDEVLDEYRSKDFDAVSFVSSKNTNVAAVQFVIKTGDIKVPDQKAAPVEEEPEGDFRQRLHDLFDHSK